MSTLLSSLKLSTRPEKTSENPTLKKREKLLTKLNQQLAMAQSHVAGETYTVYKEKWQKNAESGQQEKIKIPKKVSPWYYLRNNQYFFEVRYGNKPLELSKGNHAIEVGEKENLVLIIKTVIEAVVAGELDALLDKVNSHLSKKK
ncbi:DUF6641 family protein [Colwellia sp. PAMC 21821]|uniref:DUF6641 family protein n=1 Tax=Colwellia sp. PAMC 21821 TaxID=1816219 RepID=UPI0009BF17D9|nr:DUF6641 family protein [Colwellia sp. PAMC 21821]ARD43813.1 hypothetical protein A3Q33_05500 [Colwellia sp. PAMC 21821]